MLRKQSMLQKYDADRLGTFTYNDFVKNANNTLRNESMQPQLGFKSDANTNTRNNKAEKEKNVCGRYKYNISERQYFNNVRRTVIFNFQTVPPKEITYETATQSYVHGIQKPLFLIENHANSAHDLLLNTNRRRIPIISNTANCACPRY